MDLSPWRNEIESRVSPRTAQMYNDAMARMLEIHPDPLDWPASALEDLGDALQAGGMGEPGIKMSMSAVRQWVTWARENGITVPELRNPPPGRWRAKLDDLARKYTEAPAGSDEAPPPPATDVAGPAEWGTREAVDDAARQAAREKRAADRAVAAMRQKSQQQTAQRQGRLTKLLPEQSTLVVQRRGTMGDLINVNEYSQRDVAQSQTIEGFLRRWIQPHHEPPYEYVLTEILPNGDVRPAYNVKLDPPLEDATMNTANGAQAAASAAASEVRKALDPDAQLERFQKMREIFSSQQPDGAPPDPMARMLAMYEMREMSRMMASMFDPPPPMDLGRPGPDPEVMALRKEVRDLGEALKGRGAATEMLALIKAAQEPLVAILTAEGKRKGGGISEFLEFATGLKALGVKIGGGDDDGGGELVKLTANVAKIVEAMKSAGAVKPTTGGTEAVDKFVPPPGFKEKCAELARATDDQARVGAAAEALEILATKSTDRRWGMLLLEIARKGKAAHVATDDAARSAGRAEVLAIIGQVLDSIREEGYVDQPTMEATVSSFTANIEAFCERMSTVPGI